MADQPLILIVDDFEDGRELYADYLASVGYDVLEAGDGEEALAKAFERPPALILMDLSLPVLDGWEATRRLRSDARTAHVPVLAMTGHTETAQPSESDVVFDAVLVKPASPTIRWWWAFAASSTAGEPGAHAGAPRRAAVSGPRSRTFSP